MELESSCVYGPVWTRRFGWDLGVNLLPQDHKLCTFDCIYCQYGFTPPLRNDKFPFPSGSEIVNQWCKALQLSSARGILIRHTTFSGNGEPTMHPQFPEVAREVVKWRDRYLPEVTLAVFSNGYRVHDPEIRQAMSLFDEPVVKFDSAVPQTFRRMNQPLIRITPDALVNALRGWNRVMIQTMFIHGWNDSLEELELWRRALKEIRPREVQIYTITRLPAKAGLIPVQKQKLEQIAEETTRLLGIPVRAYS